MNIDDVALAVFAQLIQQSTTEPEAHNIAAKAYHIAEAFMQMKETYEDRPSAD